MVDEVVTRDLIIDTYEPRDMQELLHDIGEVGTLETGDYVWINREGKSFGIERKDTNDLLSSFGNGRLTDQLRRLAESYDFAILLVEGVITKSHDGKVRLKAREGSSSLKSRDYPYLFVQQMFFEYQLAGVILLFSTDKLNSTHLIRQIYKWSNRTEHSSGILSKRLRTLQFGTRMAPDVYVLTSLPNIGDSVAIELLKQFRTPMMAMAAFNQPDMVKSIRGLGEKKIEAVRKVLFGA